MKFLFKSAVTLCFLTIICVIIALIMNAMNELFIGSWFVFNKSGLIGLISGLVLTLIISLTNYLQLQRQNAKELASQLSDFQAETTSFQNMISEFPCGNGVWHIPETSHHELELALARLDETSTKIMRCERISPFKNTSAKRWRRLLSPVSKSEIAFYTAFAPFAASCHEAYQSHSVLPYLKDEGERQTTQSTFDRSLRQVSEGLTPNGALRTAFAAYQKEVGQFLGVKKPVLLNHSNNI